MIENNLYKNLSTLFPTLIYREENFLPKSLMKKYKKLILNDPCENGGKGWIAKLRNSNQTHDLSKDPNFLELHDKILDRANFYSNVFKFSRDLQWQGSWFNVYKKYDYQEIHNHNSVLSCVYFLKCNEKSSSLVLYSPTNDFEGNIDYTEFNNFNHSTFFIPAIKNSLVIFRSHLKHCVAQHMDKSLRITISGNLG